MAYTIDLSGHTALVTGASGGLGAHFARVLARSGADVVITARREAALQQLAGELESYGVKARPLTLDVRDTDAIARVAQTAGGIDILVNNAGIGNAKPALEQSVEDWDNIIDTDLRGAFFMAQAVAQQMRARSKAGTIINIASILGLRQGAAVTPYAVAKAGLVQMTKQLALEWARYNIRVNALAPGYFDNEVNQPFFATDAGAAMLKRIPMRRLGHMEDLDGPLLLLASPASAYMTGAILTMDGGHCLSPL